MDQLKGSLRFSPLPAVTQFIAGLGSTGQLDISQGAWKGEVALRGGEIVGARLGPDRGRAALEGMVLALTEADFTFVDGSVLDDTSAVLGRDELAGFMAGLVAERERLALGAHALASVPCLIDQAQNGSDAAQVTIQAAALQLIPSLVYGHTLEQIAQRRGLARTLREIAMLLGGGLVRLEAAPQQARTQAGVSPRAPAAAPTQADVPPAAPVAARAPGSGATFRPLRPVPPTAQAPQAQQARPVPMGVARRVNAFQASTAAATAGAPPVELPRPRLVREVEARPEVELEALPRVRSWRSTMRSFFIAEDAERG